MQLFVRLEILVEKGPQKYKGNTEIKPEHQKDDGCQTSINGGKGSPRINIKGIEIGKYDPEKCGEKRTGDFVADCCMPLWNKIIHQCKIDTK